MYKEGLSEAQRPISLQIVYDLYNFYYLAEPNTRTGNRKQTRSLVAGENGDLWSRAPHTPTTTTTTTEVTVKELYSFNFTFSYFEKGCIWFKLSDYW